MPDNTGTEQLPPIVTQSPAGARLRGVRLRFPESADSDWLKQWFDAAAASGFNLVIYNTVCAGQKTHPATRSSKYGLHKFLPMMKRRDLVAETCALAAGYGMAMYAGIDTLYAGEQPRGPMSFLPTRARRLLARTHLNRTTYPSGPERNSQFFCPGNRLVSRGMCDYIRGICETYPIEGLLIDFFRMPAGSTEMESSFCWCKCCQERAREELGINIRDLLATPDAEMLDRWNLWKTERLGLLYADMMACAGLARRNLSVILRIKKGQSGRSACAGASTVNAWAKDGLFNYAAVVTHKESTAGNGKAAPKSAPKFMPGLLRLIHAENLPESMDDNTNYFEMPSAGFLVEFTDTPSADHMRTLRISE